jgi:hypothetical protein
MARSAAEQGHDRPVHRLSRKIALGYEDLLHHDVLRHDLIMAVLAGTDSDEADLDALDQMVDGRALSDRRGDDRRRQGCGLFPAALPLFCCGTVLPARSSAPISASYCTRSAAARAAVASDRLWRRVG